MGALQYTWTHYYYECLHLCFLRWSDQWMWRLHTVCSSIYLFLCLQYKVAQVKVEIATMYNMRCCSWSDDAVFSRTPNFFSQKQTCSDLQFLFIFFQLNEGLIFSVNVSAENLIWHHVYEGLGHCGISCWRICTVCRKNDKVHTIHFPLLWSPPF